MSTDLKQFKDELLRDLRIQMLSLHLGDDYVVDEFEAARLIGVSYKTLYRKRKEGKIRSGILGGKHMYSIGMIRRIGRDIVEGRI